MKSITKNAYAKLNLTLDILGKREDGFHEVRMVMQSISLCDTVTVTLGGEGITCRCGTLPGDESNLAVRAAKMFFTESAIAPVGVQIDVEKHIPVGAGMAGGSADAAAVLLALRELLAPEMRREELERIGATFGSDIPFCIRGGTALAEGRGERLTALPNAPKLFAVVCKPDFSISTPQLYAAADLCRLCVHPDTQAMLNAIEAQDAGALIWNVGNVFEQVLSKEHEEVFCIKKRLGALQAEVAAMTGSGPTVFGLYRDAQKAREAVNVLKKDYAQTYFAEFV